MVYVGENVYKCTLYLCNVSKFKKCRKKGCNFYKTKYKIKNIAFPKKIVYLNSSCCTTGGKCRKM